MINFIGKGQAAHRWRKSKLQILVSNSKYTINYAPNTLKCIINHFSNIFHGSYVLLFIYYQLLIHSLRYYSNVIGRPEPIRPETYPPAICLKSKDQS